MSEDRFEKYSYAAKDAEIQRLMDDKDLLTGQLSQSRAYAATYMSEIARLRDLISSFVSWLGREQQIKSVCSDQWERGYYAALKRCDTEIWKTSTGGDQR